MLDTIIVLCAGLILGSGMAIFVNMWRASNKTLHDKGWWRCEACGKRQPPSIPNVGYDCDMCASCYRKIRAAEAEKDVRA